MPKKLFATILFLFCGFLSFGQTKPKLGVLPFTGGLSGDGETISTLFSFQNDIMGAFTVVPRTNAANALMADPRFQLSGFTDADAMVYMGSMLGADYIVSGYIRYLGDRNLLVTTIVNVKTLELMGGDYREYRRIEEIPAQLPDIARNIIYASRRDTGSLPLLAPVPLNIAKDGVSVWESEAMAQILTIEIANMGKYKVLPRLSTIQKAITDLYNRSHSYTVEEEAKTLGQTLNVKYTLTFETLNWGARNLFNATILNTADGSRLIADSQNYWNITDGAIRMKELAWLLSGGAPIPPSAAPPPIVVVPLPPPAQAAANEPAPPPESRPASPPQSAFEPVPLRPIIPELPVKEPAKTSDPRKLWTLGASLGTSFARPWFSATAHATLAPVRNMFLEAGCDFGLISEETETDVLTTFYSINPYGHLAFFMPLNKFGWYIGAGGGCMIDNYEFEAAGSLTKIYGTVNFTAGINLLDMIDISYTLRVRAEDFQSASNKLSVGYTYRFK